MLKITDEKELKVAIKVINDMNQLCKTRQDDTTYTIFKGKWYMFGDEETIIKDVASPILAKKNEFFSTHIANIKTVINGKAFYDFMQKYKKNINAFNIVNGCVVFETNLPGITYQSIPISNDNRDISEYKRITTRYIKQAKRVVVKEELSAETVAEIKKMKVPYLIQSGGIKMKLSKNVLFNTKAGLDTKINIYEIDKENNLYLTQIIQTHKDVKSDSFCLIINY